MHKEEYEKLLIRSRDFYKNLGSCHCPVINSEVIFNSKGFHHLLYDGAGKQRTLEERIRRLKLLPYVIKVISKALYLNDTNVSNEAEYWVLKDRVEGGKKVVVVLRKLGEGNLHFYSVWDE